MLSETAATNIHSRKLKKKHYSKTVSLADVYFLNLVFYMFSVCCVCIVIIDLLYYHFVFYMYMPTICRCVHLTAKTKTTYLLTYVFYLSVRLCVCIRVEAFSQWRFYSGAWGGGRRPLEIVARPPNLAVLLTHRDQLILRKISKFDATRCQILRLKCTKFDFRWGSAPDP